MNSLREWFEYEEWAKSKVEKTMRGRWSALFGVASILAIGIAVVWVVLLFADAEKSKRLPSLSGPAQVIDGDSLRIGRTTIRLNGIDAEEIGEPNGVAAKKALVAIIDGAQVHCSDTGERSYTRVVGVCTTADGRDLGAAMVHMGAALDCAHYSGGRYRKLEPAGIRAILRQKGYCL